MGFLSLSLFMLYVTICGFESDVLILCFKGYPSEPYDVDVTTERGHVLSVHIKLQPVYPEPNCTAAFDVRIHLLYESVLPVDFNMKCLNVHLKETNMIKERMNFFFQSNTAFCFIC